MLKKRMYVRIPVDDESEIDPRIFLCGQIVKVDQMAMRYIVQISDPFDEFPLYFERFPELIKIPIDSAQHCSFFIGTNVEYQGAKCRVLASLLPQDGYYSYYIQNVATKRISRVKESDVTASFINGRINPVVQMANYEFQHPCWYLGHAVVSRNVNILNNAFYGFNELAGSRIHLLPHQVTSVMRCLQESPCRFMLADEVGMGKTVEAISVLKVFLRDRSNTNVLILVPEPLKKQWETELLFKFRIELGTVENKNRVVLRTAASLTESERSTPWDFVIADEIHRCISDAALYKLLLQISSNCKNILLLSATPIQQRQSEYLSLLRLLNPNRYLAMSEDDFGILVGKQTKILQHAVIALDNISGLSEEADDAKENGEDPHESEDCQDIFDEIYEEMERIDSIIGDDKLKGMLDQVDFDAEDLGVSAIRMFLSYVCGNYQIDSNIIRNRRGILEDSENGESLLPTRELLTYTYTLDQSRNRYETECYAALLDWMEGRQFDSVDVQGIIPILEAFFSSPWAFQEALNQYEGTFRFPRSLIKSATDWCDAEEYTLTHIKDILDDPDSFEDDTNSRLYKVINALYDDLYDKKIILFTNFSSTFQAYQRVLGSVFQSEFSCFGKDLPGSECELNAYRFQNDEACRIMLCDSTGGEGRNFQCADYLLHIDLPWDASQIEQRIGRLDRLERDPARNVVTSVVVYSEGTFEESLFDFWNRGLKIFNHSLSGMEIIMQDITNDIVSAIQEDFRLGLESRIPAIIERTEDLRQIIYREQMYDMAGLMYRPIYDHLRNLILFYGEHEDELFADSVMAWAALAGFAASSPRKGIISYDADCFSIGSALKAQFPAPNWNEYLNTGLSLRLQRVTSSYNLLRRGPSRERVIVGTFSREIAMTSDYIHFFAPGNAIFDCIIENAIHSCKGTSSAMAVKSEINWTGFVFVWSVGPNEMNVYDDGVSPYMLSQYRNYLATDQIITVYSVVNEDDLPDEVVIEEYQKAVKMGYKQSRVIHMGKRSAAPGFLKNVIPPKTANIDWFRSTYPAGQWEELVNTAAAKAREKAVEQMKKMSRIKDAREEMERMISGKITSAIYYGVGTDAIEKIKQEQAAVLDVLRRPRVIMDSAAFIGMVKTDL